MHAVLVLEVQREYQRAATRRAVETDAVTGPGRALPQLALRCSNVFYIVCSEVCMHCSYFWPWIAWPGAGPGSSLLTSLIGLVLGGPYHNQTDARYLLFACCMGREQVFLLDLSDTIPSVSVLVGLRRVSVWSSSRLRACRSQRVHPSQASQAGQNLSRSQCLAAPISTPHRRPSRPGEAPRGRGSRNRRRNLISNA